MSNEKGYTIVNDISLKEIEKESTTEVASAPVEETTSAQVEVAPVEAAPVAETPVETTPAEPTNIAEAPVASYPEVQITSDVVAPVYETPAYEVPVTPVYENPVVVPMSNDMYANTMPLENSFETKSDKRIFKTAEDVQNAKDAFMKAMSDYFDEFLRGPIENCVDTTNATFAWGNDVVQNGLRATSFSQYNRIEDMYHGMDNKEYSDSKNEYSDSKNDEISSYYNAA